ncbi:hypothetical protein ACQR18_23175 [Bradyrhizobium oligotrophicum]
MILQVLAGEGVERRERLVAEERTRAADLIHRLGRASSVAPQ